MPGDQPPGAVTLRVGEYPQGRQRRHQLRGPGLGQGPKLAEHEPVRGGQRRSQPWSTRNGWYWVRGREGERMATSDQQLSGPVRQQRRQRRVAEGPLARFL